jgi:hypothetical protein
MAVNGMSEVDCMARHLSVQKRPITPQIHRSLNGMPSGGVHPLMQLQRTIGNRATQQLMKSQPALIQRDPAPKKPPVNYKSAQAQNLKYAAQPTPSDPDGLGFPAKLAGVGKADWAQLWKDGKYDEFADVVATFQGTQKGWTPDGVLGPNTWARLAGLGEAMATISTGVHGKGVDTCTIATEQRIQGGYSKATGATFKMPKGVDSNMFNWILQSHVWKMGDIDLQYRATGGAGAMVYAGLATFVDEADIWKGRLKPGAALQVWNNQKDFELMQIGHITVKGKQRALNDKDAKFSGTSMVFVRYDDKDPEQMLVRHFGLTHWVKKSYYQKWVAANVN